jgi:hypothetical protein
MIKPYNIFCDMDGVVVDLNRGLRELFGRPYDPTTWNQSGDDKKQIIKDHPNFWESLPPTTDFGPLWSYIKYFNPYILTAYAEWDKEKCTEEKWEWNEKYTGIPKDHFFCVKREEKQLFAKNPDGTPNVLIDDYKLNIQEWKAAGGIGVMHTDAAHTIMRLKNLGFHIDEYASKLYGRK